MVIFINVMTNDNRWVCRQPGRQFSKSTTAEKAMDHDGLILAAIFLFMWAEYLWELFLSFRQIKVYKTRTSIPNELSGILEEDKFQKARIYGLDKKHFENFKNTFSIVFNSAVIGLGWMAAGWKISENASVASGFARENEIATSCFFITIFNTFTTIINIPFSVYYTFVLEEKHGFNKQTAGFFIKDSIKSFILSQVFSVPITAIIVYIVQRGGDMFIVWLWMFSCIMILLLVMIYPSFIAPLFDKYSPLPDGLLRSSIEELAASLKFPLGQLYVVEGSKRSAHSNAYFYGLFGTKRIVLFDTLLESYQKEDDGSETKTDDKIATKKGCTDPEVLSVLAHELGHWSHGHIYFNLFIMQLNLLLMFVAFAFMFKYSPLYTSLGFKAGVQPVLVGLIAIIQLILAPYNALLSFMMTILSRRFEFQADDFANNLGHGYYLQKALIKLNEDNLSFPIFDNLYSAWYHSHPTLLQRLENLKNKKD